MSSAGGSHPLDQSEIERLTAELAAAKADAEQLRIKVERLRNSVSRRVRQRDEARAEVVRLMAENERLRADAARAKPVLEAADKLVERMKQAVGDSVTSAHQWLDPLSFDLFAAVEEYESGALPLEADRG